MAVKVKPICDSPVITGKYAKQVIKEANTKPSKIAILRCKRAERMLKQISK